MNLFCDVRRPLVMSSNHQSKTKQFYVFSFLEQAGSILIAFK